MDSHGAALGKPRQDTNRQGPAPVAGVPSPGGAASAGGSWVKLKTYPARQPGQPLRGTRFNRTTNKWVSFVTCNGRELAIGSYDREQDAALAHDTEVIKLYGTDTEVNFSYSALVNPATKRVRCLRTASGKYIHLQAKKAEGAGEYDAAAKASGPQEMCRKPPAPSPAPAPSASTSVGFTGMVSSGGVLGVNRYAGSADAARQPPLPTRVPRVPTRVEGSYQPQEDWIPLPERAYTASDLASVSNAREHNAGIVYEIVFPRPGALGLNLRSYMVEPPAGALPGLSPYGCLEVLETQGVYLQAVVEPGDLLIAINGQSLGSNNFGFEDAIERCSRASMPRVLRFARMWGASAAEIECALGVEACGVFDAEGNPLHLVTARLHPSAPPYFHLNSPTRQRRTNVLGSAGAPGGFSSYGNDGIRSSTAAARGAHAEAMLVAEARNGARAAPQGRLVGTSPRLWRPGEAPPGTICASPTPALPAMPVVASTLNALATPTAMTKPRQRQHQQQHQHREGVMSARAAAGIAKAPALPLTSSFSGLGGRDAKSAAGDASM